MEAAETKAAMEAEKKAVTEAERKAVAEAEKKADMEIESAARKNAESISEAFSFPSHREDKEGVELLGVQFIGDEEFEVSWVRVDHLRHYGCPDKMDIMTQMLEKYDSRIQARETLLQSEVKAEEESNSKKKKRKTAKKKAKELLEQEGDVDMDSK